LGDMGREGAGGKGKYLRLRSNSERYRTEIEFPEGIGMYS